MSIAPTLTASVSRATESAGTHARVREESVAGILRAQEQVDVSLLRVDVRGVLASMGFERTARFESPPASSGLVALEVS